MIYLINGKPYVKVSNYYKQVKVDMKGKELNITPVGGMETRIFRPNPADVLPINPIDFLNKDKKSKESTENNIF